MSPPAPPPRRSPPEPFQEDRAEDREQHQSDPHLALIQSGVNGFWTTCAAASAADNVMVIMNRWSRTRAGSARTASRSTAETAVRASRCCPGRWDSPPRSGCKPAARRTRHQYQNERSDGRKQAGGEKRDPGLVAEGRKIIDAREAHDAPPGMLGLGFAVNALWKTEIGEQPVRNAHAWSV